MRIERIGGSRLDTDSEVWGLDQTTWELMWAGEVAMQKSIPALRQAGYKSISDLPRIQKSYREKALVVIPPVIRICATWKGEQRVQVLIPVVQCTVRDANKLLDVIHKFEFWSGLRISIPKSLATGAMYGTGTARRQKGAKADAAKRKRDTGPDILNSQIQALGAMDEALDADNTANHSIKGQEAWRMNLATMHRQCPICNKKKGNCHFPTQLHLNPPCLECKHAWKPSGIKYNGTALKVTHGKTPIACFVHQPVHEAVNAQNITIFPLLSSRIMRNREILLSTSPRDTLLLVPTKAAEQQQVQQVQQLAAIFDHSTGSPRLMFTIVRVDKMTLDPGFVTANQQRFEEYSRFQSSSITTYMGMILHDATYSTDNRDSATNLIVYTIKQNKIDMTSASEGFIREFVMTLATSTDMIQFKKLELGPTPAPQLHFAMRTGSGIAKTVHVFIEENCDYMHCKACSSRRLRASCEARRNARSSTVSAQ